jgi:hypothetical protein
VIQTSSRLLFELQLALILATLSRGCSISCGRSGR